MRVDLGAQRLQFSLGRQLLHFLFAQLDFVTFVGQPDLIDATGRGPDHRLHQRQVVRQQPAAAGQLADLDHETRLVGYGDQRLRGLGRRGAGLHAVLLPPHALRIQCRRQPFGHRFKHAHDRTLRLQRLANAGAERGVVHAAKQRLINEADDAAVQPGRDERRADPQCHQEAGRQRPGRQHGRRAVARERDRDERDQRQCLLEEQVGQREPVVLVEDGKRQRDRGVMPNQLHRPAVAGGVKAAEVRCRYREQREGEYPQHALTVGLRPRQHAQRDDDQAVADRQDQEGERRGFGIAGDHRLQVEHRRDDAAAVGDDGDDDAAGQRAGNRMHHHGRQQAERRKRHRPQADRFVEVAQARQGIGRQLAEVPDQAEDGGREWQEVTGGPAFRTWRQTFRFVVAATQHQGQQHGVQRRAGDKADEVEHFRRVRRDHVLILVQGATVSASAANGRYGETSP